MDSGIFCNLEVLLSALSGIALWELGRTVRHAIEHRSHERRSIASRANLLAALTRLERTVRGQVD